MLRLIDRGSVGGDLPRSDAAEARAAILHGNDQESSNSASRKSSGYEQQR